MSPTSFIQWPAGEPTVGIGPDAAARISAMGRLWAQAKR